MRDFFQWRAIFGYWGALFLIVGLFVCRFLQLYPIELTPIDETLKSLQYLNEMLEQPLPLGELAIVHLQQASLIQSLYQEGEILLHNIEGLYNARFKILTGLGGVLLLLLLSGLYHYRKIPRLQWVYLAISGVMIGGYGMIIYSLMPALEIPFPKLDLVTLLKEGDLLLMQGEQYLRGIVASRYPYYIFIGGFGALTLLSLFYRGTQTVGTRVTTWTLSLLGIVALVVIIVITALLIRYTLIDDPFTEAELLLRELNYLL